jgi:hypothetical protein
VTERIVGAAVVPGGTCEQGIDGLPEIRGGFVGVVIRVAFGSKAAAFVFLCGEKRAGAAAEQASQRKNQAIRPEESCDSR